MSPTSVVMPSNLNTYAEYVMKPWIVTSVASMHMVHMVVIHYDYERIT